MPYLDHAGAALPSKNQITEINNLLLTNTLANPHSHHSKSLRTRQIVENARLRTLSHLNANDSEYIVVFTANTSSSLKIIAENFIFNKKIYRKNNECDISNELHENSSQFAYLKDSHHSVVGLRNLVKDKVDFVSCLDGINQLSNVPKTSDSLFILTAMSNFCGKKYPLEIIKFLQDSGWSVCLDAASLMSSSTIDLSKYKPDFVAFSYYKIFGYPTGIGALLIRKNALSKLNKMYFAGGTVSSVNENEWYHEAKDGEAQFEDGTCNYYGISQLQKGFDDLKHYGGIEKIRKHTHSLAKYAFINLSKIKHFNNINVVELYNQATQFLDESKQGPIIAFNLKRADGGYFGYNEVEKICALFGIELRSGCFCNIGACKKYLGISPSSFKTNTSKGKRCGDSMDLINGKPTGALRISFGRQSKLEDVDCLLRMIDLSFVDNIGKNSFDNIQVNITSYNPQVSRIFTYPLKSCNGLEHNNRQLTPNGLKNDRQFMIVENDVTLSLKTHPELCRLTVASDEDENILYVKSSDSGENCLKVFIDSSFEESRGIKICHNKVSTYDYGDIPGKWLDEALDLTGCRLLRVKEGSNRSLVNDSPILLINEASALMLANAINIHLEEVIKRFRANIVIKGLPPFLEDSVDSVNINGLLFKVVDKCTRCEMICIDPTNGDKDSSLITALRNFRNKHKMTFGIYLKQTSCNYNGSIAKGDIVTLTEKISE